MNVQTIFSDLDVNSEFIICETNRVLFVKIDEKYAVVKGTKRKLKFSSYQIVYRDFETGV